MFQGLSEKVALVTGGSSGLGRAIVHRLAAEGASVVVAGRDQERAEAVPPRPPGSPLASVERSGVCGPCSATLPGSPTASGLFADALARLGRLDILVNSAGIWIEKPITP